MTVALELSLPFFGLILLGFASGKVFRVDESGMRWLNLLIVYFVVPSLIFSTVSETSLDDVFSSREFLLRTTAVTACIYAATCFLSRFVLGCPLRDSAIQAAAASYGNIGYMGLPLSVAALGPSAALPAALIFCLDNLFQFVVAPMLVALGSGRGERPRLVSLAWRVVKPVVTHPFILATALGLSSAGFEVSPPLIVSRVIDLLAGGAAATALFALGVTLALRRWSGSEWKTLPLIALMKNVAHPLAAFAVLAAMSDLDPVWLQVGVMMAALPTAANVYVFARQYDAYVAGASSAILLTTLIAAVVVPFALSLLVADASMPLVDFLSLPSLLSLLPPRLF